MYPTLH